MSEQAAREIYLRPFELYMHAPDVEETYYTLSDDGTYELQTRTQRTAQGNVLVDAGILTDDGTIEPIETEVEWNTFEAILARLQSASAGGMYDETNKDELAEEIEEAFSIEDSINLLFGE